uniref:Potassium channel domain-containing protein n=1 Tax=Plectus sambesii TaxID=2011161 RepID=A0A914V865_9BILA
MSIFLLKIGHRVSKFVRLIYMSICCYPCRSRREKAHGRLMPHQKRQKVAPVDYLDEADEEEEGSIPNMLSLFIVFIYLMCGTFLFYMWQKGDNWNMVSSLYWGVVTLMTIGFGDMVPGVSSNQTTNGKMMVFVLIIYIIIGLTLVATVIDLAMKKAAKAAATVANKVAEKEEGDAKSINSNSTANTDALSAAGSKGSNKRRQPSRPISSISAADLDAHLDDVTPPPIVLA